MTEAIEFRVLYRDVMKYWPAQTFDVTASSIEVARAEARSRIESLDWCILGAPEWIDVAAMVAPIPVSETDEDRLPYLDFIVTVRNQAVPAPPPRPK